MPTIDNYHRVQVVTQEIDTVQNKDVRHMRPLQATIHQQARNHLTPLLIYGQKWTMPEQKWYNSKATSYSKPTKCTWMNWPTWTNMDSHQHSWSTTRIHWYENTNNCGTASLRIIVIKGSTSWLRRSQPSGKKLEDIRKNDTTSNSTTDSLTNLQLHNFTSLHSYPYNPRYGT